MGIAEEELHRIEFGPPSDDEPAFIVVRVFFSAENPVDVVARAGEVLTRVVERVPSWPPEDDWPDLLPSWFVGNCAPESPADPTQDAAEWLAWWQSLTPQEKAVAAQGPWTLSGWLYYFDPIEGEGDDRSWWWWNAGNDEPERGWIDVATTGWPFGTGSLYWLIEACGGTDPHC
ncbi:hypothetical protein [Microbispora rosea]|uniref:hypothetical protein n=1 Tax=Microbispora rosea TaxID=58117 RepID=UPI0033FA3A8F